MNFESLFDCLSMEFSLTTRFENLEKKEKIKTNNCLVFLKSGSVKLVYDQTILKVYKENQFINLSSLHCPNNFNYITISECDILLFDVKEFKKELIKNPLLFNVLMESMFNEYNSLMKRIFSLNSNKLDIRIGRTLYYNNTDDIDLRFNASEWANYVGTTEESVVRRFSQLDKDNVIRKNGHFRNGFSVNKDKLQIN